MTWEQARRPDASTLSGCRSHTYCLSCNKRFPSMTVESTSPEWHPLSRTVALARAGRNGREAADGEGHFWPERTGGFRQSKCRSGHSLQHSVAVAPARGGHRAPPSPTLVASAFRGVRGGVSGLRRVIEFRRRLVLSIVARLSRDVFVRRNSG
jgi:hypothetical protein